MRTYGLIAATALTLWGCHKADVPSPPSVPVSSRATAASGSEVAVAAWQAEIPLIAAGDQPQWSIRLGSGSAEVKTADGVDEFYPLPPTGRKTPLRQIVLGTAGHGALLGFGSACSGSSGPATSSQATIGGRSYTGCARPASAADVGDWSDSIYARLPAMRTCLRRTQSDNAVLTRIASGPHQTERMRLRMSDGTSFDCVAASSGERVISFDAVKSDEASSEQANVDAANAEAPKDAASAPAPTSVRFALTAAAYANLGCEQAPATVLAASAEVVGYLQFGGCDALNPTPAATDPVDESIKQ
jgi:uncharacterized membrane protein